MALLMAAKFQAIA